MDPVNNPPSQNQEDQNPQLTLLNLPLDHYLHITQHLTLGERSRLWQSCRFLHQLMHIPRPLCCTTEIHVYYDVIRVMYGDRGQLSYVYSKTALGLERSSDGTVTTRPEGNIDVWVLEDLYSLLPFQECKIEHLNVTFIRATLINSEAVPWNRVPSFLATLAEFSQQNPLRVINCRMVGIDMWFMPPLKRVFGALHPTTCKSISLAVLQPEPTPSVWGLENEPTFRAAQTIQLFNMIVSPNFVIHVLSRKTSFTVMIETLRSIRKYEEIIQSFRTSRNLRSGVIHLNQMQGFVEDAILRIDGLDGAVYRLYVNRSLIQVNRVN